MKKFKVNGNEYEARPFDFNLVCDLENMGVSVADMGRKHFATTRAYFALCAGMSNTQAGKEMELHVISGGNFEDINNALNEEMDKSDFFLAISKKQEKKTGGDQEEEK